MKKIKRTIKGIFRLIATIKNIIVILARLRYRKIKKRFRK